jgi:hypothetical protein
MILFLGTAFIILCIILLLLILLQAHHILSVPQTKQIGLSRVSLHFFLVGGIFLLRCCYFPLFM